MNLLVIVISIISVVLLVFCLRLSSFTDYDPVNGTKVYIKDDKYLYGTIASRNGNVFFDSVTGADFSIGQSTKFHIINGTTTSYQKVVISDGIEFSTYNQNSILHQGTNNVNFGSKSSVSLNFRTNDLVRLILDNNGRAALGGAIDTNYLFKAYGDMYANSFYSNSGNFTSPSNMTFDSGSGNVVFCSNASSKFGIGRTPTLRKLEVEGSALTTASMIAGTGFMSYSGNNPHYSYHMSDSSSAKRFDTSLDASGNWLLRRFDTNGAPLDNPISVNNATGNIGFGIAPVNFAFEFYKPTSFETRFGTSQANGVTSVTVGRHTHVARIGMDDNFYISNENAFRFILHNHGIERITMEADGRIFLKNQDVINGGGPVILCNNTTLNVPNLIAYMKTHAGNFIIPVGYNAGACEFFWKNGTDVYRGTIANDGSTYFTGQHVGLPKDENLYQNLDSFIGYIVVSTGNYINFDSEGKKIVGKEAIEINNALPELELSKKPMQKSVFGVVSNRPNNGKYDDNRNPFNTELHGRVRVNSLGEGAIWVCSEGGDLSNGDYICTSNIPGIGMKQKEDTMHNYTVAKITTDCDFSDPNLSLKFKTKFVGDKICAFVGCTYHCA